MKLHSLGRIICSVVAVFGCLFLLRILLFQAHWSALERSISSSDRQGLEKILKANPSLANKRIRNTDTPLNLAVRCQRPKETIDLLVKYGANINAPGWPFDTTPLQSAAWSGKTDAVKALLAHKPDVNAMHGDDGSTALNYALVADNKEIFCLLLAAGADINHGRSALAGCMVYAESARPDWTEFLLSHGADPNRKGTSADRFPPLIQAVLSGSTNRVAALLRYRADQSVIYENGADHFTPLALALDQGHLDVALVIGRANLQARTNSASLAAYQGASESLRTLLATSPNAVSERDELGFTPLHWAAVEGRRESVELLLAAGAEPKATDKVGYHPLVWAAQAGHLDLVQLLVTKSAGQEQHAKHLNLPLALAVKKGNFDVALFLLNAGADANAGYSIGRFRSTPLQTAVLDQSTSLVELLLSHGADVPPMAAPEGTLVHLWVYGGGAPRIADLLLSLHIDVNAKDGQGETPLHLAVRYGQKPAVEWLLKHGADVNARNLRAQTPVELLKVRRGVIRHKDIADLLQNAGNR
jgi:ankyrin repeat protein